MLSTCPTVDACTQSCLSGPFARVRVVPTLQHGATVSWALSSTFQDARPHTFQLQVSKSGLVDADDWVFVGDTVVDSFEAFDPTQRDFGKTRYTHYRVRLQTAGGIYYSLPQSCWANLDFRSWRLWLARERQWKTQLTTSAGGRRGYLLKRRLTGEEPKPDNKNVDWLTSQPLAVGNTVTKDTEYVGGYFDPVPCVPGRIETVSRRSVLAKPNKGSANEGMKTTGVFLTRPQLDSRDVWVDGHSDMRYEIHTVVHEEDVQGLPVVYRAELRMLPFGNVVYSIPVP